MQRMCKNVGFAYVLHNFAIFCTFFAYNMQRNAKNVPKYAKNAQEICKQYAKKSFGMALLWPKHSSKPID